MQLVKVVYYINTTQLKFSAQKHKQKQSTERQSREIEKGRERVAAAVSQGKEEAKKREKESWAAETVQNSKEVEQEADPARQQLARRTARELEQNSSCEGDPRQ